MLMSFAFVLFDGSGKVEQKVGALAYDYYKSFIIPVFLGYFPKAICIMIRKN